MKKLLLFLAALVLTVCSTAKAEDLYLESEEGTIGTLDGREAMVVDLGGTIGKVAIATKNVGATSVDDYGTEFSSEADFDPASLNLADGWYVPTIEELSALMNILQPREMTGFEYIVGESVLYFPGFPHHLGGGDMYVGQYWSSSKNNAHYQTMLLYTLSQGTKKIGSFNSSYTPCAVRPFHKLHSQGDYRITYTTTDGSLVTEFYLFEGFGVDFVSDTYENGQGTLLFSKPVEKIGHTWFARSKLSSITIPASVTSIEQGAFSECPGLTDVQFANDSRLETIGYIAFFECKKLASITIPASVTSIEGKAFTECHGLTDVQFANGSRLETIGVRAFFECTELASITIPASVTSIEERAFEDCGNLTNLQFANGSKLKTIGEKAFSGCKKLGSNTYPASLTLPPSLQSIGAEAFMDFEFRGNLYLNSLPNVEEYAISNAITYTILTDSEKPFIGSSLNNYPENVEVDYNRTLEKGKWGTVVLPFAPMPEFASEAGVKFYELSSMTTGNGGTLTFKQTDEVAAGVPYLIKNEGTSADFTLTRDALLSPMTVTPSNQTVGDVTLKGSFQQMQLDGAVNQNLYYLSNGEFYHANGKINIAPFRAYIEASGSSGAAARNFLLLVSDDGNEVTAIADILDEDGAIDEAEVIYDLSGRQLDAPVKGQVNIVRTKGGKTIKRMF